LIDHIFTGLMGLPVVGARNPDPGDGGIFRKVRVMHEDPPYDSADTSRFMFDKFLVPTASIQQKGRGHF
jgi:hypothetical protein